MLPLAISTVDIVLLVLLVIVGALAAGGGTAISRRARAGERTFLEQLRAAERELAQARSTDKGWDRAVMESAAQAAVAARFGATPINGMQLVQVIDKPGTDADQAVFLVETGDGEEHHITLGRSGGVWGAA
jgi:type II secretory pathway pseudopilin PulG